jgi:hypothetical protein
VREFLATSPKEILGSLASHAANHVRSGVTHNEQIAAWEESLGWLRATLADVSTVKPLAGNWSVCLEYAIPRRASRIDAVLLADDLVFVLEFKSSTADAAALRQAEDYAMELHDFHAESRGRVLIPVVCAGAATRVLGEFDTQHLVARPSTSAPHDLAALLVELYRAHHEQAAAPLDPSAWLDSAYLPTPTILEAARALYAGHEIADISRAEASGEQLERTERAVHEVAARAHARGQRAICFITGVPGAGKTLAGLNIAYRTAREVPATFLTGNAPLVDVLTGLLKRESRRKKQRDDGHDERAASSLVTKVGDWLKVYADAAHLPNEKLVIFDEAQRAWNSTQMHRKNGIARSQPELLLSIMERHADSTVVALVGNGQEINDGETGLGEWGNVLTSGFESWHVALAPGLLYGGPGSIGAPLLAAGQHLDDSRLSCIEDLHLSVSQRSFRSTLLTQWVEQVLGNEPKRAAFTMEHLAHYPIVLTHNLDKAREWLRAMTRGERRCGLLASSGGRRLRPHGISVSKDSDPVAWFLNDPEDLRSSNFLEVVMSEFMVQGLELDWVGVCWDTNLARSNDGLTWDVRELSGSDWRSVKNPVGRSHVINAYRVLLTRAREGMVIWIPPGDERDPTRDPKRYHALWNYLTECGAHSI